MEASVFQRTGVRQQIHRLALFVAHNQQTVCGFHLCSDQIGQFVQTAAADPLKLSPPECRPKRLVIRYDIFRCAPQWVFCLFKARLRCRAQNNGRAALLAQKLYGKIKKRQQLGRYGLNLVDYDDTVTKCLKSSDRCCFSVEQGIQQLNQRRQNDWRVPVLHQQLALVKRILRDFRLHNIGMVLQNQLIVPNKLPDDVCILLQN